MSAGSVVSGDDDRSWLEEDAFSTPRVAARRFAVTEQTLLVWARAGYIRYVCAEVGGRPVQYLLCDEDLDRLVEVLAGVANPSLSLLRLLPHLRRGADQ